MNRTGDPLSEMSQTQKNKSFPLSCGSNGESKMLYKCHIIWYMVINAASLNQSMYMIMYSSFLTCYYHESPVCDIDMSVFKKKKVYI